MKGHLLENLLLSILLCMVMLTVFLRNELLGVEKVKKRNSLVIGLIPEQNIFKQLERYEPLTDYLSKKVGVRIKPKVLTLYGDVIDNFSSLGLDGAFLGSFAYVLAHRKLGLEVLARPETVDGKSTYHGLIFARKDSGIKTIRDMRGKTFAFVDKTTTAGYLFPLIYFNKYGIKDYQSYFKETYFTGTHEDAIRDVLNKKADVGAAKNTVLEMLATTDGRITTELSFLETSLDVPENGLAVRGDLDDSIKQSLKNTLLTMHNDPEGKMILQKFSARRFIPTINDDYQPLFKYVKEINLHLDTYDYVNK